MKNPSYSTGFFIPWVWEITAPFAPKNHNKTPHLPLIVAKLSNFQSEIHAMRLFTCSILAVGFMFLALRADGQQAQSNREEAMKLIYVFDPLCGWCYGFSHVITEFAVAHPEMDVEVVAGGMVLGERVGPLADIAPYLRGAYKNVEERTGVTFGEAYLNELFGEATMTMDSEPPSRALAAFRAINPNEHAVLRFASAIQKAIYYDGVAPRDVSAWVALAVQNGLDARAFEAAYNDPATEKAMLSGFGKSDALGVTGFPTVVVAHNEKLYAIARGYADLAALERALAQVKAE